MDFIRHIKKAKLRRKKYELVLLIKHYRRSSLGRKEPQEIRNTIIKNHFTRKEYLTLKRQLVKIRSVHGISKRVKDVIARL